MEAIRPKGRGRPKKCPRRESREAEGANKIHAAEEMTETSAENYGSDGNNPPVLASEDSPENNDTVAVEPAPAPVEAATDANDRLPSAIVIKPRRRPRKGIPVRSPFF